MDRLVFGRRREEDLIWGNRLVQVRGLHQLVSAPLAAGAAAAAAADFLFWSRNPQRYHFDSVLHQYFPRRNIIMGRGVV